MAKKCDTSVLDGALNVINTNVVRMCATQGEPSSITDVTSFLGAGGLRISDEIIMAPADLPLANEGAGPNFNRKIDVAAKGPINVGAAGTPDHVVLYSLTTIYEVTTITTPPTVTTSSTLSFPTWQIIFNQPV